jgi:hypothetical protein
LDSKRDIYPWPYAWSRDIDPAHISRLTLVRAIYENLDFWTYQNHWYRESILTAGDYTNRVDVYWKNDDGERQQLPPPIGDHVVGLLVSYRGDDLLRILWNYNEWTPEDGWQPYTGEQGDFVDHIHLEFVPVTEES